MELNTSEKPSNGDSPFGKSFIVSGLFVTSILAGLWFYGKRLKGLGFVTTPWQGVWLMLFLVVMLVGLSCIINYWARHPNGRLGQPWFSLSGARGRDAFVVFGILLYSAGYITAWYLMPQPTETAGDVLKRINPKALVVYQRTSLAKLGKEYPELSHYRIWLQQEWPNKSLVSVTSKPFESATKAFKVGITPGQQISTLYAFRVTINGASKHQLEILSTQMDTGRTNERIVLVPACEKGDFLLLLVVESPNTKVQFGDVK